MARVRLSTIHPPVEDFSTPQTMLQQTPGLRLGSTGFWGTWFEQRTAAVVWYNERDGSIVRGRLPAGE